MLKRMLLATAALSFIAVPAFAGDAMKATGSADTTTDTHVEMKTDTGMAKPAMSEPVPLEFLTAQHTDEVRAEQLIGTKVINRQSEEIGEIADLLLDQNKGISGAVISVGGFLGVGEKLVAVNADAIHFQQTQNGETVALLETSREDLEGAPSFELANESYFESVQSMLRRHSDGKDEPATMSK